MDTLLNLRQCGLYIMWSSLRLKMFNSSWLFVQTYCLFWSIPYSVGVCCRFLILPVTIIKSRTSLWAFVRRRVAEIKGMPFFTSCYFFGRLNTSYESLKHNEVLSCSLGYYIWSLLFYITRWHIWIFIWH